MRPPSVKLHFRRASVFLLQWSIELVASLNVRLLSASNELLSVLASFARHPMLHSPKGDSGYAGKSEGGANPSMRPLVVKLLFRFTRWLLLQLSIELVAFLNVRL